MFDVQPSMEAHVRSALLQIIRQCNYRCAHCSQDAPHIGDQANRPVPLESVRHRLAELKRAGLQRVRFTGGEPLLHPDLAKIVSFAKTQSLDTSIVTNGSLLNNRAAALADAGIRSVWISLYGSCTSAYSALAGRKAPEQALCDAIGILADKAVKVGIYCSLSPYDDCSDLSLLNRLVSSGATHVKFMQLMEQGRHLFEPAQLAATRFRGVLERVRTYSTLHLGTKISMSMRSGQRPQFLEAGFKVPSELSCTAGSPDSWSVSADGELKPCCLMMPEGVVKALANGNVTVPLRFSLAQMPAIAASAVTTCPALPHYGPHPSEAFICPIVYANL